MTVEWKQAALPSEHGGWGLTIEPILLGLLVAPSWGGVGLALAAFFAFLVRTPLKLVVIDRRRRQWQRRSTLAARFAVIELLVIAGGGVWAVLAGGWSWVVPVACALPLVGVELWFDVRSRGRRLVPELCGAAAISVVATAIMLAAGRGAAAAVGAWLVLAARSVGAIPFVRVQIVRLRRGAGSVRSSDVAQVVSVAVGAVAVVLARQWWAGLVAVMSLAALQVWWVRQPPVAPKVLGVRQMALGMGLVLAMSTGVWMQ